MRLLHFASLVLLGRAVAQQGGGGGGGNGNGTSLSDVLQSQNATLSVLNSLIQSEPGILNTLGNANNITILAPNNDAFASYLNDSTFNSTIQSDPGLVVATLQYHVLNGTYRTSMLSKTPVFLETLLSNTSYENVTGAQVVEAVNMSDTVTFYSDLKRAANVTQANLNFTGGVIHIIDQVLRIPQNLSSTAVQANLTAAVGALTAAGNDLVTNLEGMSDLTVFVPDNEAFQAIAPIAGNLTTSMLQNILEYHVIEGTVGYSSLLTNESLQTAEGSNVTIKVFNDTVFVDNARVVVPDVLIANGVVHVIDSVLNPNATNNNSTASPTATTPAFPVPTQSGSATGSGEIPFTSGIPTPTGSGTATGLTPSSSTQAATGPDATAAAAFGALFGGAAFLLQAL